MAPQLEAQASRKAMPCKTVAFEGLAVDACQPLLKHVGARQDGRGMTVSTTMPRHVHTHQVVDVDELLQGQEVITDALGLLQGQPVTQQFELSKPGMKHVASPRYVDLLWQG